MTAAGQASDDSDGRAVGENQVVEDGSGAGATTRDAEGAPAEDVDAVDASELALGNSDDVVALLDKTRGLSQALGRDDLLERLTQARSRLLDPHVRVLVLGQFKQGKSKLVNALVNAPICPIDDDIATSVPTSVGYGAEPSAMILVRRETGLGEEVERIDVPIDELAQYVSENGNPDNIRNLVSAEVALPREILRGGLRIVDSPGVGGIESTRSLATLAAIPTAHAIIMVSDASQEYTEPEMQFIRNAVRLSPHMAAVLSKTDIYPHWRDIERVDRGHLGEIGGVPVFSVSSDLRLMAAEQQDEQLNRESGFPGLVRYLRRDVLGRAGALHRDVAVHDLQSAVDQLAMSVRAELTTLMHPEQAPRLIAQLEEAKVRVDEFRSRTSRWQLTLSDGVADLISDMEHDLRDRLRKVQREAEAAIDEGDPGPIWDTFTEWLNERVSQAVAETFVWTNERSQWLCEEVAEEFAAENSTLPMFDVSDTSGMLDPIDEVGDIDAGSMGTVEKIYLGLRGSYGGVLMTGVATSVLGMSLLNPLSLFVGVLVGRRAYREDQGNRLLRRQMEAKNVVRRHIDEVTFQVGKPLRDRLRLVQRVARDHFGGIADSMNRSLTEAVQVAKRTADNFQGNRDERVRVLQSRQQQIEYLRHEIAAVAEAAPQQDAAVAR